MKIKFAILGLLILLVGVIAQPSYASLGTSTLRVAQKIENRASAAAAKQADALTRIIQRADQLITTRLDSLQKLLSRITSDKRLSDTDKTSLTSDINTASTDLQNLKTKIDADTDETTAREDAKSIITNYRIYVIFEPKLRLLTIISNLQTTTDNVSSLSGRVQTLITDLKSQGKDTTAAQSALDDINSQLTTINTTLSTDKTLVSNVNVGSTNPQSVFVQVRKDLAGVRSDFAKIRSDLATIRSTLKLVVKMSPAAASNSAK
ncbi:MAG TPA: hypothetical protein VF189_02405 [Patescibacteria group bacterium]